MGRLSREERNLVAQQVFAAGGEVVPETIGFGEESTQQGDIVLSAEKDHLDFQQPDAAGEALVFADLPANQLHAGLEKLDRRLTPRRELRRLTRDGALVRLEERVRAPALLLVHGTFSSSDKIVADLQAGSPEFLTWALDNYPGGVLTFDYPTLSRQALANALGLRRLLGELVEGPLDVISHSQGGLVTRFWLEALDPGRLAETRAIFVAGTLGGTSLAAPWALRRALVALGNVAWVLTKAAGSAGALVPFFGVVSGLLALLHKSVHILATTPAIDAGVALVPGITGMSQVRTNAEIGELQRQMSSVPAGYFAITGDFEPQRPGWAFWRRFYSRTADSGADLLFGGPNDLVVDTAAQTHLADGRSIPRERVFEFRAGGGHVHHMNYFRQSATADVLQRWLSR